MKGNDVDFMVKKAPQWLRSISSSDPHLARWFVKYCSERVTAYIGPDGKSRLDSYRDYVVGKFEQGNSEDYLFLKRLQQAYLRYDKRRRQEASVQRTYDLSPMAIEAIDNLSDDLGISRNILIETLILQAANVRALYDQRPSRSKKLTIDDVINPFAKQHGIGDYVFGSKSFPDERTMGKKIESLIRKVNKLANRNIGKKDPLLFEETLRLFEREGVVHNISKPISHGSAPGRYGKPLSPSEVNYQIDELRIEDVFYLEDSVLSKLVTFRDNCLNELTRPQDFRISESDYIELLLDKAFSGWNKELKVNTLEAEIQYLKGSLVKLKEVCEIELEAIDFEDERMNNVRDCINALMARIDKLYRWKIKESGVLKKGPQDDPSARGFSMFASRESEKSLQDFHSLAKRIITGTVHPEEIDNFKLSFDE